MMITDKTTVHSRSEKFSRQFNRIMIGKRRSQAIQLQAEKGPIKPRRECPIPSEMLNEENWEATGWPGY